MNLNLTIRNRMLLFILGSSIVIYVITLSFLIIQLRENALEEGMKLANSVAKSKAQEIENIINQDMAVARTLTMSFLAFKQRYDVASRLEFEKAIREQILKSDDRYVTVWSYLKQRAIDEKVLNNTGTESLVMFLDSSQLKMRRGIFPNSNALAEREWKVESVMEPYMYEIKEGDGKQLMISPQVTAYENGLPLGSLGLDILLDEKFFSISKLDAYQQGLAMLVTHSGTIVSHREMGYAKAKVDTLGFDQSILADIKTSLEHGTSLTAQTIDNELSEEVLLVFEPIKIGRSEKSWMVGVEIPLSAINESVDKITFWSAIVAFFGLLGLSFIIYRNATRIASALERSSSLLSDFAEGKLNSANKLKVTSKDEIGQLSLSINKLMDDMMRKADFSSKIGQGKLHADFEISGEQDLLGKSLLAMRDNLNSVILETNNVIREAGENGKILSARIEPKWGDGAWNELAESINKLLDSIVVPFNKVNHVLKGLASGDLRNRFDEEVRGDIEEMAANLNQSMTNIHLLLKQLGLSVIVVDESSQEMKIVSEEMQSSSEEIAIAIGQISAGAHSQVSKVDESSKLITSILKSANEMNEKAIHIYDAAAMGAQNSQEGLHMIGEMGSNLQMLVEFSAKTNDSMTQLKNQSDRISSISKVIAEIADQTNLLSLNAAIEAAQAGDQGRGFSVIANEIRNMSEDTKKSSSEIQKLIGEILRDLDSTALEVEKVHKNILNNADLSQNTSMAFSKIAETSSTTLKISEEVQSGLKRQLSEVEMIVSNVEQIVVVSEESASATEQIAASASELTAGMSNFNEKSVRLSQVSSELTGWINKFQFNGA